MEATFETNPVFLSSLLSDLGSGKIQLPDFQRGWVWEDERIRGVLASVSRSFPIGALMMLETGGETKFHPRPVEGVNLQNGIEPDLLVLDGQQRLTSLFQATTYGKVVSTINIRKQPIKRWFFQHVPRTRAIRGPRRLYRRGSRGQNFTHAYSGKARPIDATERVRKSLFPV
jgi:hypothetical protein